MGVRSDASTTGAAGDALADVFTAGAGADAAKGCGGVSDASGILAWVDASKLAATGFFSTETLGGDEDIDSAFAPSAVQPARGDAGAGDGGNDSMALSSIDAHTRSGAGSTALQSK